MSFSQFFRKVDKTAATPPAGVRGDSKPNGMDKKHKSDEYESMKITKVPADLDEAQQNEGLFGSQDSAASSVARSPDVVELGNTDGKRKRKYKVSPLRAVDADEPAVGSLFNTKVRMGDRTADITSPKFDPALFDISSYVPKNPPSDSNSLLFSFLTEVLQMLDDAFRSGAGSRKYVHTLLSNFFRVLIYHKTSDIIPSTYIMLNRIAPEYEGKEVGVGDVMVVKVLADHFGKSEKAIKELASKYEDLGIVASLLNATGQTIVRMPDVTIASLLKSFKDIAAITGKSSSERKCAIIKRLLFSSNKTSKKYIIRWLQQNLRVGVNAGTLYQSMADAFYLTKPGKDGKAPIGDVRTVDFKQVDTIEDMEKALKTAIKYFPCIDIVLAHLLDGDNSKELLEHCKIRPGIPVRPMLAKVANKNMEVFQAMGSGSHEFTCEYKYDGERIQLHMMKDKTVKLFSRNMENISRKYPDLMRNFLNNVKPSVEDCIIDGEVVGCNPETGAIYSFQTLSTRKRKISEDDPINVPACLFAFDIIYRNGESLMDKTLAERRKALVETINDCPNVITFATHLNTKSPEDMEEFFYQAINDSCEGLIIKTLEVNASYEPEQRTGNWLKLKKDYVDGLGDTFDLVPIAAFCGKGKRTSLYGSYLLAVYDPELEVYQATCKTGSGFTDKFLQELHKDLQGEICASKPPNYDVHPKAGPVVWLNPVKVWECKGADLTLSPLYTAAKGLTPDERGISLRFPRFIKVRSDKNPTDATTSSQIYSMFSNQKNKTVTDPAGAP